MFVEKDYQMVTVFQLKRYQMELFYFVMFIIQCNRLILFQTLNF